MFSMAFFMKTPIFFIVWNRKIVKIDLLITFFSAKTAQVCVKKKNTQSVKKPSFVEFPPSSPDFSSIFEPKFDSGRNFDPQNTPKSPPNTLFYPFIFSPSYVEGKILSAKLFPNADGKDWRKDVVETGGQVLIVSQFTVRFSGFSYVILKILDRFLIENRRFELENGRKITEFGCILAILEIVPNSGVFFFFFGDRP
jgi:hypothetical protein